MFWYYCELCVILHVHVFCLYCSVLSWCLLSFQGLLKEVGMNLNVVAACNRDGLYNQLEDIQKRYKYNYSGHACKC